MFDDRARRPIAPRIAAALAVATLVSAGCAILAVGSLRTTGAWADLAADRDYLERLAFSLVQAAAATAIGLLVGLPASWMVSRSTLLFRGVLGVILAAPIAVPGVVMGLGIDLAAGGVIVPRVLVVAAHAIFATAAVVWLVSPSWNAGDPAASEDARLLGARRLRAYFAGTGRDVPRAARVAGGLAFWYAFAAAGTVALLGGTEAETTESVLAFGQPLATSRPELTDGLTAQQSVVAIAQTLIGVAVLLIGGVRWPHPTMRTARTGGLVAVVGLLYVLAVAAALWAPVALVTAEGIGNGAGGAARGEAFRGLADASVAGRAVTDLVIWSLVLGALAATVATFMAWVGSGSFGSGPGRRETLIRIGLALPVALTGATLGWVGLLIADRFGLDLDRTYLLTVAAHALLAYPLALRIISARRPASPRLMEDWALLGGSPRSTRWRWNGRRTLMALASTFLLGLIISAAEVAATALLTPAEATPVAVALLRAWVDQAGDPPAEVYALGAALTAVTVIGFGTAEWLRRAAARVEAG